MISMFEMDTHQRSLNSKEPIFIILFLLTDRHIPLPRMIAGGEYNFFRTKRGRLFEGGRLFEEEDYFPFYPFSIMFHFPFGLRVVPIFPQG